MKNSRYRPPVFPFTALVGQELLKKSLVLNAVNSNLQGLLIRGDKGTAKSTAVRGLASLLPEIEEIADCPFHCDPDDPTTMCLRCRERMRDGGNLPRSRTRVRVVDLPLNATEDRLVGSIDFEYALRTGRKRFLPGILAEANRGIIYIDEVNLLEDHLVDILLDTAVTGLNLVEREGISYVHPSRYILIATMNPEEGDIRPQLLDRFGLCVAITGLDNEADRMEVAMRRDMFDTDPEGYIKRCAVQEEQLRGRILAAREILPEVEISNEQLSYISGIALAHFVSGHRADVMMGKTARTIAALAGRTRVINPDIEEAAELVLLHRAREPSEAQVEADDSRSESEKQDQSQDEGEGTEQSKFGPDQNEPQGSAPASDSQQAEESSSFRHAEAQPGNADFLGGQQHQPANEQVFNIGRPIKVPIHQVRFDRDSLKRRRSGRRTTTVTDNKTGRYVRATMQRKNNDLAFDATLRAAAPYQKRRPRGKLAVQIREPDIREKIRQKKTSNLLLFVVDASGSMGTRLMAETKGAILSLLLEAYQKRDRVGMIAFKGMDAGVLLPPTNSIEMAKKLLEELPTGGKTPLGKGLLEAYSLLSMQLRNDPNLLPMMILVTDGRANVGLYQDKFYEGPQFGEIYREIYDICELFIQEPKIHSLVIDAEEKRMGSFGRSKKLAEALRAKYYVLEELISEEIVETIKAESPDSL
jgi:magnesium chelatase subunit D